MRRRARRPLRLLTCREERRTDWLWWLIGAVVVVLWLVAIVAVLRRRHERSRAQLAAWLLLVLFLPGVGTASYLGVRASGSRRA